MAAAPTNNPAPPQQQGQVQVITPTGLAPSLPRATAEQMQQVQAWKPRPEGLERIVFIFREPTTAEMHQQQYTALQQLQTHPEFHNYMAWIMSSSTLQEPEVVRRRAGLMLRNVIKGGFEQMNPAVREYIKMQVLNAVSDNLPKIRSTVASIISTIATKDRLENWPQLMPALVQLMDSPNAAQMDGALSALSAICEEAPGSFDSEAMGPVLNTLIPKFLSLFSHKVDIVRQYALGSVNQFLFAMPDALKKNIDKYLQGLVFLTNDTNKEILKRVCQAWVMLLELRFELISKNMRPVIAFMIKCTADKDELVAQEACEFWNVYCEHKSSDKVLLRDALPNLIPVLLKAMCYDQFDLADLDADEEDYQTPDKPSAIRPIQYHRRGEQDDDDDDEERARWNLRKCAASSLDQLANVYHNDLLQVFLPVLHKAIGDKDDWKVRESAILALGAVAEGCYKGIEPYLPKLFPFLLELLKDKKGLVRSITCWTLSRYCKFALKEQDEKKYFEPLLTELLRRVLDHNKKVQEAACSAFATLEEEASDRLVKYLPFILKNLMHAFGMYQAKNELILYDAISTLAESVRGVLNNKEYIDVLLPPLLNRWSQLADDDKSLLSLLECLCSVIHAVGTGFLPFAKPAFLRSLKTIQANMVARQQPANNREAPDAEFTVGSLDVISAIIETLGPQVEALIPQVNLLPPLHVASQDVDENVRQSAFAVLGDLARVAIVHLRPHLEKFVPSAAKSLEPKYVAVCNNASWSIGEMALRAGPEMKQYVRPLLEKLVPIVQNETLLSNLLENTTITIGRLAALDAAQVGQIVEKFGHHWCVCLTKIRDLKEKEACYRAFCQVIQINPRGLLPHFSSMCIAFANWQPPNPPSPDLKERFKAILHSFKTSLGAQHWPTYFGKCSPALQQHLAQLYGL